MVYDGFWGSALQHPDFEEIRHDGELVALVLRSGYGKPGINFLTPPDSSLQLGHMTKAPGERIQAHRHLPVERKITGTMEAVFIRKGRIRVDFFTSEEEPLTSRELCAGDMILLTSGGHGFTALEESDMVEVKQGPYAGDNDKVKFGE